MSAPLYLRCNCHTAYHFVLIEDDPDTAGMFSMSVVSTRGGPIWRRIRNAARYVFGFSDLIEADVILTAGDYQAMLRHIGEATA